MNNLRGKLSIEYLRDATPESRAAYLEEKLYLKYLFYREVYTGAKGMKQVWMRNRCWRAYDHIQISRGCGYRSLMEPSFVYYITVFIFIEDWVGLQSSAGSLNAKIFTFLASLCLFSFSVGVLTDPGYAPSSYLPDVEDSSSVSDEEPKKNGVQSKYCDKCAAYKPPRAHHCRVCRRCILRMDHHCLWINNCVGYWNYKAFFTLVLYATIGSIHSTIIVISCACQKDWNYSGRTPLKIFYTSFIHIRGPVKVLSCLWSNDGCIICNTWDSLRLAYLPNNSQYDNHRGVGSQHAEMVMASINQPSERWS
ncbi:hypothetical protein POUND7_008113 [Theobroma cacao]